MRPPSSQQASRSGVGLDEGLAVAAGVRLAVALGLGEGEGEGETVEVVVGLLVAVSVSMAVGIVSEGRTAAQAVNTANIETIKINIK